MSQLILSWVYMCYMLGCLYSSQTRVCKQEFILVYYEFSVQANATSICVMFCLCAYVWIRIHGQHTYVRMYTLRSMETI